MPLSPGPSSPCAGWGTAPAIFTAKATAAASPPISPGRSGPAGWRGGALSPHLAESRNFFVGHFLLPAAAQAQTAEVMARACTLFRRKGRRTACAMCSNAARDSELGPRARGQAPFFWQVAGMIGEVGDAGAYCRRNLFRPADGDGTAAARAAYRLPEPRVSDIQTAGDADLLPRVFPELLEGHMRSVMVLGHSRYSTNTLPSVTLSQPFSMLCHNGEINTIDRLRDSGRAMGITPVPGGSDSQDLNRVIEGLVHLHGLDIMEALEMVFPPVYSEVENYPSPLRELYAFYRWFFPVLPRGRPRWLPGTAISAWAVSMPLGCGPSGSWKAIMTTCCPRKRGWWICSRP